MIKKKYICVFIGLFIMSCASKSNTSLQGNTLLTELIELQQAERLNLSALRTLSKTAQLKLNWRVVWESQLMLCQRETSLENKKNACERAKYSVLLIPNNEQLLFQTTMSAYFHTSNTDDLEHLQHLAKNEFQQAEYMLATGQIPTEDIRHTIAPNTLQQARFYYLQGKKHADLELLQKAAKLFKQHNQLHNVADSLFLLAKLNLEKGNLTQAKSLAVESLLILDIINNDTAYNNVKRWINDRLSAR